MARRDEVYTAINGEREYQKSLALGIGDPEEHKHSLEEWTIYIQDYLDELTHSLSRVWRQNGLPTEAELNTLRKITTMGVAAMEQLGAPRREGF
jgi:hypothetical protein